MFISNGRMASYVLSDAPKCQISLYEQKHKSTQNNMEMRDERHIQRLIKYSFLTVFFFYCDHLLLGSPAAGG